MTILITEGGVDSLEVVKILERCALRGHLCKDRKLSSLHSFAQSYGGTKVVLTTRIKKGAGKGKLRTKVFYRKGNTFENLTWIKGE